MIEFKTRTLAELGAAAHRRPPRRGDRPALRLARRAEGGRIRPRPADGVERRGAARLPAARRPGPAARHHHRAQRAGQPAGHRERTAHRPGRRRRGDASRCRRPPSAGASTASTSTWPTWSTSASATRPATYLAGHGWQIDGSNVNELLTRQRPARRSTDDDAASPTCATSAASSAGAGDAWPTDTDSWDLASSVGATATMVAAARAIASREPERAHRRPVRRAAGAGRRHRLLHPAGRRRDRPVRRRRRGRHPADDRRDGGAHPVLRRLLHRRDCRRDPAGGDPGVRPRLPRLPAAVAGGHRRLRDRPAQGDRVQDRDDGVDRRRARRRERRAVGDRPARGLAGGVAPQRVRRHAADGVERRGAAGVPAARRRRTGCSTTSPRCQRAGQPAGHRIPPATAGAGIGRARRSDP